MIERLPRSWGDIRRDWPAKAVLLIAQPAIVRKLIVVDLSSLPPASLAALAGLILALGITYWLMQERDDRLRQRAQEHERPL